MEAILITYLNNGNLQSQVAKEVMFNRVVEDLIASGKVIENTIQDSPLSKHTSFTDGTKVYVRPFGQTALGLRFTHLYVDEIALSTFRAKDFVNEMYKVTVANHENMLVYSFDGKHITKRSLNEYGL